ncbi:hypothetical protein ACHHYP_04111 [Achlya hypogyna]|uniref:FHA domain-containing protein n=1 Tax=Achlya hypogyna TaxID=1202772 RepID=A0A1V9Z281_ACHHY|nr:hypothetical protein ACHHYP_04111 [Achlya hypogyna]
MIDKFRNEAKKARQTLEASAELAAPDEAAQNMAGPPRQLKVMVTCTKGYYQGQTFELHLSLDTNPICHLGRSSGKKYKSPLGLSLPKDPEVSTTHAELRLSDEGKVYFTDVNSTNGTTINDKALKPRKPLSLPLDAPAVVSMGSSDLTFTFAVPSET